MSNTEADGEYSNEELSDTSEEDNCSIPNEINEVEGIGGEGDEVPPNDLECVRGEESSEVVKKVDRRGTRIHPDKHNLIGLQLSKEGEEEGKLTLDELPPDVQSWILNTFYGLNGAKRRGTPFICKYLMKEYNFKVTDPTITKWLRRGKKEAIEKAMSAKNLETIDQSYGSLIGNYCDASILMYEQLKKSKDEGKVRDMKDCFDSLTAGLQEVRNHLDMNKTSSARSAKSVINEVSSGLKRIGNIQIKDITV